MAGNLDQRAVAWLETVGAATADTVQHDPRATIAPRSRRTLTAQDQALTIVEELSDQSQRLRIQKTIGRGGMGVVRLAEQTALGRTVAVKGLRADRISPDAILHLMREAWITGSLEHPNVVPVHDIGVDDDGNPLIILKRIEGVPWLHLLRDGAVVRERFGAEDLLAWNLNIFLHVVNAIRFAHSCGIVHRDVKPENIMIGEFGEVYVLDWGIAVSLREDGDGRLPLAADATEIAGTPCYMAPEMLGDSHLPLSERTDIYLLGGLLYEIIAGEPPHRGESAIALIRSVLRSEPSFPDDAPSLLADICRRAMAAEPAERYGSADELRAEVLRFLDHRGASRLAERAGKRLRELEVLLAEERPESSRDEAAWRQSLYRSFGACRFGFQEALSAQSDNRDAQQGLQRAIELMTEHELDSGHPSAAEALVAELTNPPAALLERVAAEVAAEVLRSVRMEELERMKADLDIGVGVRTRTFVASVLSGIWVVAPLILLSLGLHEAITHERLALALSMFVGLAVGLFVWGLDSMTKTAINRRIMGGIFIALLWSLALALGFWSRAIPVQYSMVFCLLLWAMTSAFLGLAVESRIWPVAAGYLAAFGFALWRPLWWPYWIALGNLGMFLSSMSVARQYTATRRERRAKARAQRAATEL